MIRSYLKNTPGLYWVRDPSFVGMTVYYCLNWRCLEMLNHLQFLCSANLIPLLLSSQRRRDLFLLNNIFEMASSYLILKTLPAFQNKFHSNDQGRSLNQ